MKKKEEKGKKTGAAGAAKRGAAPPQAAETGGADVKVANSQETALCAHVLCARFCTPYSLFEISLWMESRPIIINSNLKHV